MTTFDSTKRSLPDMLADVVKGKTPLVGSRLDPNAPRGLVSPVESRVHLGIPYGDLAEDEAKYLRERRPSDDAGVLLRALIASVLAQDEKVEHPAPKIVSAKVHNLTINEALDGIFAHPGGRRRANIVHFVHPHASDIPRVSVAFNLNVLPKNRS